MVSKAELGFFGMFTVKLVYNDHPRDPKLLSVIDRWSLFGGHLC